MLQDLRAAFRSLRRAPVYALGLLLMLGLGLGVNLALGSLLHQVVRQPFDAPEPERLVGVEVWTRHQDRAGSASAALFLSLQQEARSLSHVAVRANRRMVLEQDGRASRVWAARVSASLFPMLGLPAWFVPAQDRTGGAARVVLAHATWMRDFGGDPAVVGRPLRLDGVDHEVVGILPADLRLPGDLANSQIYVPLALTPAEIEAPGTGFLSLEGRLRSGMNRRAAEQEVAALYDRLETARQGADHGGRIRLPLLLDVVVEGRAKLTLLVALAGVFLLVLACSNAANLVLARWAARGREVGLRTALGANLSQALRPLLMECGLLLVLGGALALLFQVWGLRALQALLGSDAPAVLRILPLRLLGPTLGGFILMAAVLLLLPLAWTLRRIDAAKALGTSVRGTASAGSGRLRGVLVVTQVALATALLATCLVLLRGAAALAHTPLGFDPKGVWTVSLELPKAAYPTPEARRAFQNLVLERAAALPGVVHASLTDTVPLGHSYWTSSYTVDGGKDNRHLHPALIQLVSGDYFGVMGLPQVAGRGFLPNDLDACVVNETFARRAWPGQDPLGRLVQPMERAYRVVGVVLDARHTGLTGPLQEQLYLPLGAEPPRGFQLLLRASSPVSVLAPALRGLLDGLDRGVPAEDPRPWERHLHRELRQHRALSLLFGAMAALSLTLAVLGLGGALNLSVSQRRGEIGVRMALGARTLQVLRLVLGQGVRQVALGLALGLPAALGLGHLLGGVLEGLQDRDPKALMATVVVLALSGLSAALLPALRAARIAPAEALRSE